MTSKPLLIAAVAVAAMALASCAKKETPPPYDVHLDMKEIMGHVVDPGAWAFWRASGDVETAEGVKSNLPTTQEGWEAAESGAAQVAEAGNILLLPGYNRNEKAWTDWVLALQKAGFAGKEAAEKHNAKAMFTTGAEIYRVCTGCHAVYVIPQAIKAAKGQKVVALPDWPSDVIQRWPAGVAAHQHELDLKAAQIRKEDAAPGS